MRCFCCDSPSSIYDGATGRDYCHQCWTIIDDMIFDGRAFEAHEITEEELESEEESSSYPQNVSEMWT